jgi:hypothetical protein
VHVLEHMVGRCSFTQVHSPQVGSVLTALGFQRLKLKYAEPLSSFAFNLNLRRYNMAALIEPKVGHGRCRLTRG